MILFIADLHLSPERPDIFAAFRRFMQDDAPKAERLYVLGDLFEAWIGDDDNSEFNQAVIALFKANAERGVAQYFIHGNRDFLISQRFARAAGMALLPEETVIDLYGTPALILHGDSLCTLDADYQAFRKKSRSWFWQWRMQLLPLWLRRRIARKARAKSQAANAMKSDTIMDVTPSEVDKVMAAHQVGLLIHGHTHRPNRHPEANGERIVLGDWYEQGSVLIVTEDEIRLESRPFEKSA
ncbi:UDP-2,3-diacylglucosamine diphosphatase [Gallaecimonas pentaromativorans]|uniref:UDP-2,3-diacylglucosamine diphosphatase n=1 Tax=Gallaecimonas pentaromativorans TaxID=584787 RepID=UPI00067F26D1|nr:UDP-2,3-diacylglucosamine diphosphatase [Gallaecimonas pentaromativorans]MED5524112.1 UDP-2,3-diacylglucosamine diphosphatase [Pseudomonadota bacterium]